MKRVKEPKICEVKIHGRDGLPTREPKICEVKIFGKGNRDLRTIKDCPTVIGMNQIVAQVANRLSRRTRSFKDGDSVLVTLPEWQAIRKSPVYSKFFLRKRSIRWRPDSVAKNLPFTWKDSGSCLYRAPKIFS